MGIPDLVNGNIPHDRCPDVDPKGHILGRLIEDKGDPQGKPSEKVINGVFIGLSEDLKEYRGLYLGEVARSAGPEY